MTSSPKLQADETKDELVELLQHWKSLSSAQCRAILALKDEIEVTSSLVEQSTNDLSEQFQSLKIESVESQKTVSEIITKLQFQDRTSQRLGQINSTLIAIVDMLKEMEKKSEKLLGNEGICVEETQWIEKMLSDMNLGEMRKRFVENAMIEAPSEASRENSKKNQRVDFSEPSDDIELF